MNINEMWAFWNDEHLMNYVDEKHVMSIGFETLFILHSDDGSTLQYLNNNNFPVVYSDTDGFIVVKF